MSLIIEDVIEPVIMTMHREMRRETGVHLNLIHGRIFLHGHSPGELGHVPECGHSPSEGLIAGSVVADPSRNVLCHHDRGEVRRRCRDGRHDRGIGDRYTFYAVHRAMRIGYGSERGIGSHGAGANGVVECRDGAADPCRECFAVVTWDSWSR